MSPRDARPTILVHGGAGPLPPDETDPEAWLHGVEQAARAGLEVLLSGGSALDGVEAAVRALEDDPDYNAGTGACLTADGDVELDASIMDGATLRCGAVAAVRDVKNPVTLARRVMEGSPHVLLVGDGASRFARSAGIAACANASLVTAAQRVRWERLRAGAAGTAPPTGTVGAVARDSAGHLAAATSTGGTAMKLPGRVGDSALIGCGTYADDALAAVSCTGHGERVIQLTLARHCADLVGAGRSAADAACEAVRALRERVGGEAGLIVIGARGDGGSAHGTPAMRRAWVDQDGKVVSQA